MAADFYKVPRATAPREDGGFSGVSSSCGACGGFLTRQDEDLREPLVRCQGSQVSVRVARGSASWLSSHGRGLGPRDALIYSSHTFAVIHFLAHPYTPSHSVTVIHYLVYPCTLLYSLACLHTLLYSIAHPHTLTLPCSLLHSLHTLAHSYSFSHVLTILEMTTSSRVTPNLSCTWDLS